ncbi:MAG: hypothetical protein SF187_12940 [Deltaproteobacteria bacterium]|nr:hypothetical protein [Deltaproteobacteria bacterium]
MREFGLNVIARAIYDVTFAEFSRPFAHALAVIHAAHGAEIVLKARIAEEHPLLIFKKLPQSSSTEESLTIAELFEFGRSVDYDDLPELLWATTGIRIERRDRYQEFGRLRNKIMHFAVPEMDHSHEVLSFCIEVLEPLVFAFWQESAVPLAAHWDEVILSDGYLDDQLTAHVIDVPLHVRQILDEAKES